MLFRFDQFELDEGRYELRDGSGRAIELQPKVMEVLLHLVRNADRTLGKDEILDAVWNDVAITEASLTRCISLARRALGEGEGDARIIRTVRGRGYRVGVEVVRLAAAQPGTPTSAPESGPAAPLPGRRRRLVVAGAVLSGVGILAWLARPFHEIPLSDLPAPGPHPVAAVAVLPFGDLRADGARSREADEIALQVIDELSRWPALRVTSFRSSFRYSPTEALDPSRAGRELGVGTLVTGSLRAGRDGGVEVLAELVDTANGFQRWSASFELPADAPPGARAQVASQVRTAFGVSIQAANPLQMRGSGASRDRMLREGRHAVLEANRETLLTQAASYEHALELEPGDLRSRIALAETYNRLWERDGELGGTGENWLVSAEAEARAALERAPHDPWVLTIYGTIATSQRDWTKAERMLRRALAAGGGAYASHRLAVVLLMAGRIEEARGHVERALELDPLSSDVVRGAGRFHLYAGEARHAVSLLRRALELDPNDFYAPRLLATAHVLLGEEDAARESFMRFMPGLVRPLARIQARLLGTDRTLRNLLTVDVWRGRGPCRDDPLGTALMWAYLDERGRTLECLEIAARHHLWYVAVEPTMKRYHGDPEFRRIVREAGHVLPGEGT